MSKSIDQRVLEMQFDNKQFESNVKTSINTLDNLKKSLDLSSSSKSLDQLSAASNSFSLDGIGSAVETISDRFSAFGIFSVEILRRISNAAIDCGQKMVTALTIEPAKAGFQEYELKMGSVQTIMASTGESLETVNKYLQELNQYSDDTIYSFADMTQNIGKFTNAGVKLEDAVLAIKGISNEAALSGANANEASRAMYNFAQALSAGYVKLIDWKSIENANMATKGFKEELIATAVEMGTLKESADGMYDVVNVVSKANATSLNATKNFNDSLGNQWMTTDVLIQTLRRYADETTEIGGKASQAATEIKTFTMMMDTLRESAQSGWATSLELIVGDFNEARELWTTIGTTLGNMISESAEERNKLISGWADGGGRQAIIDGFGTAWKTVLEIIKPVRAYFRDIFPKVEAEKLIEISNTFKVFTETLSKNDKLIGNLQNTFKGFFAVLGIAKQIFTALINTIKPVFGIFGGLGESIFKTTGSIGEWLVNLNKSLEETAFFETTFSNIAEKIRNIFNAVKSAITNTISSVKTFGNNVKENVQIPGANLILAFCDTLHRRLSDAAGSVEGFKNIVRNAFTAISEWFETSGLATVFGGLLTIMQAVFNGVIKIGEGLAGAFKTICDSISTALANADFETGFDILNSGLFAAILIGIKKFVDGLKAPFKDIGSFTEGITDILGSVKGCFEEWQASLKSGTLLKIAGAIAILAAALVAISLIDSEKLALSLTAVVGMLVELMFALNTFSIIAKNSQAGLTKLTTAMLGISVAVLVLSVAMKSLADLEWDDIGQGLLGLAGMTAVLVVATQQLSKNEGKLIRGAGGLVVFAVALRVLVGAVEELGALDLVSLGKGLVGVGVLMAEISAFIKAANFGELGVKTATGILVLAFAVKELSESVAIFGSMDIGQLGKGLAAVGIVLKELSMFVKQANGSTGLIKASTGMVILGGAMLILAEAVKHFGSIELEPLVIGLIGMGAALKIVTMALNSLPDNMIEIGVSMVAVSAGLQLMANAITTMGSMSWEELIIGLVALGTAMKVISVSTTAMTGSLKGAAALLVVAAAIGALVPSLVLLSKMSLAEVGKGLLALGGALGIFLAAGAIAGVVVPGLLALGGSLALIGIAVAGVGAGLLAAGVGLAALGTGLTALGALGATGAAAVVAGLSVIVVGIAGLIPAVVAKIGEAFVKFCEVIIAGAPVLAEAILVVIESVVSSIITTIPMVLEGFATLLDGILQVIVEFTPKLLEGGLQIILAILNGISTNIMAITEAAVDIITQFLAAIATKIPEVIQAGFDILLSFINGMTEAINGNVGLVVDAFNGLILAIVNAAITSLKGSIDLFKVVGKTIMDSGLVRGIKEKVLDVISAFREIVNRAVGAVRERFNDFRSAGREIINGFVQGVKDKFMDAINAGKELGNRILSSVKGILGIASPAKEFIKIGRWSVLGLAQGLKRYASAVSDSAKVVANNALDAMSQTLSTISDAINGSADFNPVITPVLDLSNVENGSRELTGMLSAGSIELSSARVQTANISRQMGGSNVSSSNDVVPVGGDTTFTFTQNNYSPVALSRAEIYRQTNNQFTALKGLVAAR